MSILFTILHTKGPFINYGMESSNHGGHQTFLDPSWGSNVFRLLLGGVNILLTLFQQCRKDFTHFFNLPRASTPQPMLKFDISRQRSELNFLTIFGEKR